MRQAFSFYKSFDDTFEALNDQQTLTLFKTLRDVQFLRLNINEVKFNDPLLTVLWQSIKFSLEKSIKGYLDSQLNSKVKNPFFGCYASKKGYSFNPLQTPYEGVRQQEEDKEEYKEQYKEEEQEELIIDVFKKVSKNYKAYAIRLFQDFNIKQRFISTHFKNTNESDFIKDNTWGKYCKLFYNHVLNEYTVHNNYKQYSVHFSRWINKQEIVYFSNAPVIKPDQH